MGVKGADRLAVAVLLGDEGVFHGLARVRLHVVTIDVDGVPRCDLGERHQAPPERGLEIQGALDGDVLEEAVLRRWRGEKGQASEEAEVGAADRIDGANTGCVAEDGLKDEAQGKALLRDAFVLGGSQRCGEVVGAKL